MNNQNSNNDNNSANGVHSYDSTSSGSLIHFFNRNVSEYPTEQGVRFDLVPVTKQKDIMVNVARLHAKQEYNRIMELVEVLQRQAESIKRRLDITDMVHGAKYDFQVYHDKIYWLVYDTRTNFTRLVHHGPTDWSTGAPVSYEYICRVKWLGDYSWQEVDEES
jgi:hypothetical protein